MRNWQQSYQTTWISRSHLGILTSVPSEDYSQAERSSKATTAERLRRLYQALARETEADRPLWQAVVLAGARDPVRSPDMRGPEGVAIGLLREILPQGQKCS